MYVLLYYILCMYVCCIIQNKYIFQNNKSYERYTNVCLTYISRKNLYLCFYMPKYTEKTFII